MRRLKRWIGACGVAVGLWIGSTGGGGTVEGAPPTAAQRSEARDLSVAVTKAGNLFKDGKFKESADVLKDVQGRLEKLVAEGGADITPLVEPLFGKLERAHALLELEGVTLPPLKKPTEAGAPADKPAPGAPPKNGELSFVNHVAPVMISKCGRCHVQDARGMFSMANYSVIMKGPTAGKVIFPGDPSGSRLIEVIESGDMPRGGLKVTPEELTLLKKWIQDGAKFDGKDEMETLTLLAPSAKPSDAPKLEVMAATGKETVSFARDVAPVLAANCVNCHGAMQPRENFSLLTFQALLRGGDSGAPIVPGKPAESLLIKKIQGTGGGQRMPVGRPALTTDVVAKLEKWIEEGARFDGDDPAQEVGQVAALARARGATHEQLTADRAKLADENWRLGMPGIAAARFESANFLVLGNVGENTLADIGQRAEALAPKVGAIFRAPEDRPLIKGRMTLFVFNDRYSYSEFGQMVERRQIPKEWRGHFRFSTVDSYGAVVPSRGDEYSLDTLVAQQLAGAYVASLGKVPRWFAEGCSRVAAARLDPSDSRVGAWNEQTSAAIASVTTPEAFLKGDLPPEVSEIGYYSFATFLMNNSKAFPKLMDDLRKGAAFDKAFSANYGGSPEQAVGLWVRKPPTKPTRSSTKGTAKKASADK